MKSVVDITGLRDIRTALSTHSRSASTHKGTPYLEILSLGMEQLRLNSELARLAKRVERVDTRLKEIRHALGERLTMVAEESPPESTAQPRPAGGLRTVGKPRARGSSWKTMAVEY